MSEMVLANAAGIRRGSFLLCLLVRVPQHAPNTRRSAGIPGSKKRFSTVIERSSSTTSQDGMDDCEHFHDRLPGQPEAHRVKEVGARPDLSAGAHRIFAGFRAGKYVHSNLEWDISPMSLERLECYVSEVLSVAHRKIDEEFVRKGMSA